MQNIYFSLLIYRLIVCVIESANFSPAIFPAETTVWTAQRQADNTAEDHQ